MSATIISSKENETQILVTVQHGQSMLAFEEQLQKELNLTGQLATACQLERFDTDGAPILQGAVKFTSKKKKEPKVYESPWGQVRIERYVYQSSQGGKIFCPLDQNARIVVNSTPAFARMASWKYAHMAAPRVEEDLLQNHGRSSSGTTLRNLADVVGSIAQAKEESWRYDIPELPDPVATVSIGLDGTSLLYRDGNYRMAMCGTVSLLNSDGERLHTLYCAAAPEYGKPTFMKRLSGEITKIKRRFPQATYVGVADGAPDNWKFLEPFVSVQVLDFFHVSEYVTDAADALYPGVKKKTERQAWLNNTLHRLKHDRGGARAICDELQNAAVGARRPALIEKLHKARTYFKNNWRKMVYPDARERCLPIGSGVTEAACKVLVKQRMCHSGMRWKETGVSMLLTLRSLVCTKGHWQSFWEKIDRYGFPIAHNLAVEH